MADEVALPERAFDKGFDGHRRRQAIAGLQLTYAQRLQWLEDTMAEMRRFLGRARDVKKRRR